jgi:4-hydroxy-tetrahydrodipicolinate reductase
VKVALLGHGRMGRAVEARARAAGYEIGLVVARSDATTGPSLADRLRGNDVAIDFSGAGSVPVHVVACVEAQVPLVEGTTGWRDHEAEVRRLVERGGGALVYAANFSPGVHLFYRLVSRAGELFCGLADYDAFIEEAHHAKKRDAPSGTALVLRDLLAKSGGRAPEIASTRAGHIPGTHRVGFDSAADQVVLEHTARSREGFAAGALLAARWVIGRRGVFAFEDVVEEVLAFARTSGSGTAGETT